MSDLMPFPRRLATKLRHPDIVAGHWYEYVLSEDEHGVWTVLPAGEPTWFAVGDVSRLDGDQMRCYDADGRWVAQFWSGERIASNVLADGTLKVNVVDVVDYVDMARILPLDGGDVSFVDLVLDVARYADHRGVAVLDEDEVDEEVERYGIPAEYIALARITCAEVHAAMKAGLAPFDGTADLWRAKFRASVPAG